MRKDNNGQFLEKFTNLRTLPMTAKGDKSGKWTTVFSAACLIL